MSAALSDWERFGRLAEQTLERLEGDAAKGKPPTPQALGTLARLLERRDKARQLEEMRELTAE